MKNIPGSIKFLKYFSKVDNLEILYKIDAIKLEKFFLNDGDMSNFETFDRIIWNFPHVDMKGGVYN